MAFRGFLKIVAAAAIGSAIGVGGVSYVASNGMEIGRWLGAELPSWPVRSDMRDRVRVVVAKMPLAQGAIISTNDLQWVEWPEGSVPKGAFTNVADLLGKDKKAKVIVLRAIEPGEPILVDKITKLGGPPAPRMNLKPGMRAVSIRISDASGVSGFVASGDHVDILLTRSIDGRLTSSVILQDIEVIAVDQTPEPESSSPRPGRTIALKVDTNQAQKLALGQQMGALALTLRGAGDKETAPVQPWFGPEPARPRSNVPVPFPYSNAPSAQAPCGIAIPIDSLGRILTGGTLKVHVERNAADGSMDITIRGIEAASDAGGTAPPKEPAE